MRYQELTERYDLSRFQEEAYDIIFDTIKSKSYDQDDIDAGYDRIGYPSSFVITNLEKKLWELIEEYNNPGVYAIEITIGTKGYRGTYKTGRIMLRLNPDRNARDNAKSASSVFVHELAHAKQFNQYRRTPAKKEAGKSELIHARQKHDFENKDKKHIKIDAKDNQYAIKPVEIHARAVQLANDLTIFRRKESYYNIVELALMRIANEPYLKLIKKNFTPEKYLEIKKKFTKIVMQTLSKIRANKKNED